MNFPHYFNAGDMPQLASWVGFDRVFDELQRAQQLTQKAVTYPPYNIRKTGDNTFVIELAVAGFSKTEIEITTKDDQLVVKGQSTPDTENNFIYRGIAARAFERSFTLADTVVVKNASMLNGMLRVMLEQITPDEKKPRKVEINEVDSPDIKTVKDTKQFLTEGKK